MTLDVRALVRTRLTDVIDPCSVAAGNPMNVVEMGLIDDVQIDDGLLTIRLCLTSPQCLMIEHFAMEARRVTADLSEVRCVTVRGDDGMSWTSDRMTGDAQTRRAQHLLRLIPVELKGGRPAAGQQPIAGFGESGGAPTTPPSVT